MITQTIEIPVFAAAVHVLSVWSNASVCMKFMSSGHPGGDPGVTITRTSLSGIVHNTNAQDITYKNVIM